MTQFNTNAAVGEALRTIRSETGKSQTQAAHAIGKTQSELSYLENGKRTPQTHDLYMLAAYYGVDIGDFFPREEIERAKEYINE